MSWKAVAVANLFVALTLILGAFVAWNVVMISSVNLDVVLLVRPFALTCEMPGNYSGDCILLSLLGTLWRRRKDEAPAVEDKDLAQTRNYPDVSWRRCVHMAGEVVFTRLV